MNATRTYTNVKLIQLLPNQGRAQWIEAHGPIATHEVSVSVTGTLAEWEPVADILIDGTLARPVERWEPSHVRRYGVSIDDWIGDNVRDMLEVGQLPEGLEFRLSDFLTLKKAEKDEEAARTEAATLELLAKSDAWWDKAGYGQDERDPRIKAKVEASRARRVAAQNAEIAAKKACTAALIDAAKSNEQLRRAAEDGYEIASKQLDAIAAALADKFWEARTEDEISRFAPNVKILQFDPRDEGDRGAPQPQTFEVRDVAERAITAANATLAPEIGQWKLSRIVRVDACEHNGGSHWVTGVVATLETLRGDRAVVFSRENLDCNHDDED